MAKPETNDEQADGDRWEALGALRWTDRAVMVNGVEVPARVQFLIVDDAALPGRAEIFVEVDPVNGPVARGLRVIPAEADSAVTYRDMDQALRALPRGQTLDEKIRLAVRSATAERAGRKFAPDVTDRAEAESVWWAAYDRAAEASQPRRRRNITPELLAEVATVYREAMVAGNPPTQAVAEHFTTSHRTATRWVAEARSAGALGAALGPKPGEG